jgi:GNAT superfamily N-acetyltransferase
MQHITWSVTDNPDVFRDEAGVFVAGRPDMHTMLLSGLESIERLPPGDTTARVLGWWGEARTTAAFVWMPPHLLAASHLSEDAATNLVDFLSSQSHSFTGIVVDDASAAAFSAAWEAMVGSVLKDGPRLRLYRLQELIPLSGMPLGTSRTATLDDRPLLHDWCGRFVTEAGSLGADLDRFIDERLSRGGWRLWMVAGEPVAMAAMTSVVGGMARITPVYTRPEHRGQGYGAAVTAAVSQAARDAGAEHVLLYTDLANPTSNSVYRRIGYQPVADYRIMMP